MQKQLTTAAGQPDLSRPLARRPALSGAGQTSLLEYVGFVPTISSFEAKRGRGDGARMGKGAAGYVVASHPGPASHVRG